PAPSAAADAMRVARIARLMELNRQRVGLEVDRVGLSQRYGENHPDMVRMRNQIAVVDAAIQREFVPEEQAAVARYADRAMELQLRMKELQGKGLGENHPQVVAVRMQLGLIKEMASDLPLPATEASLAAKTRADTGAPEPHIELAMFYLREGRRTEAERALRRALDLLRKQR
ncbi:MAG: hypothetical protein M3R55_05210, partial [Acidobacteriota bacterium]|nr:hypothetical protein [Acidobacteriota bacterium]